MSNQDMRSLVFFGKEDLRVEHSPVPECDDDKILVKVDCCGICTYEQRLYNGVHKLDTPLISGHEVSGRIVKVGKGIRSKEWAVGDTVVVGVTLPCRDCFSCKSGESQNCDYFDENAKYSVSPGMAYPGSGGMADYTMQRPECVFKYHSVTPEEACMAESLSCVIHSVETADPQFGQYVLVIGAGFMGQLHTLLSLRKGCCVIVSDMNEERLALARELGAHHVINPAKEDLETKIRELTHGHMAGIVFDTTPIASVAEQAVSCLGHCGKLVIYSGIYPNKPITVDPHRIHKFGLQILGTANSNDRDFHRATQMISNGVVDLKPFISGVYDVDHVHDCLRSSCTGQTFRNIVSFQK